MYPPGAPVQQQPGSWAAPVARPPNCPPGLEYLATLGNNPVSSHNVQVEIPGFFGHALAELCHVNSDRSTIGRKSALSAGHVDHG